MGKLIIFVANFTRIIPCDRINARKFRKGVKEMDKKTFYLTTPIYYVNDVPHIGHAYTTTACDVLARFKRLAGYDVYFLTGTDEHGQKIERSAQAKGIDPQQYVDQIAESFWKTWEKYQISNDDLIRTTQVRHKTVVQKIFQKLLDKGDIYKGKYSGWYCTPCESFWLENQLKEGKLCPDCGRPTEWVEEESYFFRISQYQDRLLQFYEENPNFIQPVSRRNEMINFVKQGLEDLSVSRTTFNWGIPVLSDPKHVVYVWIDALTNYISALGYASNDEVKYDKYWPADLHMVGKEIMRFHTIIWPAILMALDLPLPKKVFGHGWWTVEGEKMSKSKGNVINPIKLVDEYGLDQVRYFILREVPFGLDGDFSYKALKERINFDLANDLGNLLNRTLAMVDKYFAGFVPASNCSEPLDQELKDLAGQVSSDIEKAMEELQYSSALSSIWKFISRANKYIDETAPWALAKDEVKKERLATVMYNLLESLRIISIMTSPFLILGAEKMWQQLGFSDQVKERSWQETKEWNITPVGQAIQKGSPIYPRLELEKEEITAPKKGKKEEVQELITIDDFAKLDLRVGKVLAAEKVEKADKLLKLQIDLGTEKRQVVSGIAQHYMPDSLIGKNIILVANLKPVKLRGIESAGMILAATDANGLVLGILDGEVAPGSKVK